MWGGVFSPPEHGGRVENPSHMTSGVVQRVTVLRSIEPLTEFVVEPALESLDPVGISAGEDGHEFAASVAADDVLLAAQLGQ